MTMPIDIFSQQRLHSAVTLKHMVPAGGLAETNRFVVKTVLKWRLFVSFTPARSPIHRPIPRFPGAMSGGKGGSVRRVWENAPSGDLAMTMPTTRLPISTARALVVKELRRIKRKRTSFGLGRYGSRWALSNKVCTLASPRPRLRHEPLHGTAGSRAFRWCRADAVHPYIIRRIIDGGTFGELAHGPLVILYTALLPFC